MSYRCFLPPGVNDPVLENEIREIPSEGELTEALTGPKRFIKTLPVVIVDPVAGIYLQIPILEFFT